MERITKKREDGFYELIPNNEIYGEGNGIRLVQIVGQLEDIEEELGINPITLFKGLKNGTYDNTGFYIKDLDRSFYFKDYGIT